MSFLFDDVFKVQYNISQHLRLFIIIYVVGTLIMLINVCSVWWSKVTTTKICFTKHSNIFKSSKSKSFFSSSANEVLLAFLRLKKTGWKNLLIQQDFPCKTMLQGWRSSCKKPLVCIWTSSEVNWSFLVWALLKLQ